MKIKRNFRKNAYTLVEVLITILVMSIFFLIISVSFNATCTAIKTERYVYTKITAQDKFQVLFGIIEDTLKWSGSMNVFLKNVDGFKSIDSENGIQINTDKNKISVQTAVVDNLILKKVDGYDNKFECLCDTDKDDNEYEVLLIDKFTNTTEATVINLNITFNGTEAIINPIPPSNMEYCFLIRDRDEEREIEFDSLGDKTGFTDKGYQVYFKSFYFEKEDEEETGKVIMETWKPGFTYSPTVVLLDNVLTFIPTKTNNGKNIEVTISLEIPRIKKNKINITKKREFWIPDEK